MFLYLVTNTVNGKRYIGQTRTSLRKRWAGHCVANTRTIYLARAIKKHGRENFTIEPLLELEDPDLLNELEAEYIKRYCSLAPNGYNIKAGGSVSALHPDTKAKLRLAHLGKSLTQEHKDSISKGLRESVGFNEAQHARRGTKLSPETCRKMSETHKNMPVPWAGKKWAPDRVDARREKYKADGNPHSKLSWENVDSIREMYATGKYSQGTLAAKFEINQTQISKIVLNQQWVRKQE